MLKQTVLSFILLGCLTQLEAAWDDPYFKDAGTDDVVIEKTGDPTIISMDEEIPAPFIIAVLEGYKEDKKPEIGSFQLGSNLDLGLDFERNSNDEWNMIVTKKQDYEQIIMQNYEFRVRIEQKQVIVLLRVKNIFDNAPVITSLTDSQCIIKELQEPDYQSPCEFNVFDADGLANNAITFRIEGKFNESRIFTYKNISQLDGYNFIVAIVATETIYYDQRSSYNFRTFVSDINNNIGVFNTLVEIEDLPNKEPMWTRGFASARFPEKEERSFDVIAIDGDTGINTEICYRLDFEPGKNYSEFISIDETTGRLDVDKINRDERKNEFYPFEIFAYKCNNHSSFTSGIAALIIDDINDNYPEIYFPEPMATIKLKEEVFATLLHFYVEDIDLGQHASYEVVLSQETNALEEYAKAFNIIPINGYQTQSFTISVADTSMIDFEDANWQNFEVFVKATEIDFQDRQRTRTFSVELLNWNDELPMFENEEYKFSVLETVGVDHSIGFVHAEDRDIDDKIEYFISGSVNKSISVDIFTGELKTLLDRTFDYERQTELLVQVRARDTLQTMNEPTHTTFTQVRIEVIDVNDKPPTLQMPRKILSVQENVRLEVITSEIEAYDPDTTADLKFTIDWKESYAAKPGFVVEREFFEGCFIIEKLESDDNNNVLAALSVNNSFHYNIDYEKFEVVYLFIVVEDVDQKIMPNTASAILVVQIGDENDNPPEFVGDTLTVFQKVYEEAAVDTLIGNVVARDIDGPGNNVIQYSLIPNLNTPADWLTIDVATGVIRVLSNNIGCDDPRRDTLDYRVRLFDGANETFGEIKIEISDINNKVPKEGLFDVDVSLYENATTGDFITKIIASDLDRDEPHNIIQFYINYRSFPELQRFFTVDELTGVLSVNLFGDSELDRDNGEPEHFIRINFDDNFQGNGARNGNQTLVHLILKDVNDNAPEMPEKADYEVEENSNVNLVFDDIFYAHDKDDPATPNSEVRYEILTIEPVDVDNPDAKNYENLFGITSYENKYGRLFIRTSLRGYSGRWKVDIKAYDRGDLWDSRISLSSEKTYYVVVKPYNFNSPSIIYPRNDASIRLDFNSVIVGESLTLIDGRKLTPFEAVDDDAGVFGDVTFELVFEKEGEDDFEVFKINRKQSELRVRRGVQEKTYIFNVVAFDGGRLSDRVNNVRISFVNQTGEPYFTPNTWTTDFTEDVNGRSEERRIPEAFDPKNVEVINEEDKYQIYYFIDENYKPEHSEFFQLDKVTRMLSLTKDLDRELVDYHELRIISTNLESYPTTRVAENSYLLVGITVNDVNNKPPRFVQHSYAVGVSEDDNLGKSLITLFAEDPDLNDVVTYYLMTETITTNGENIEEFKESAFIVGEFTGILTLNFKVQPLTMKGFFEFKVQANDLVNHTDEASVKVFLVAEANRVTFVFLNDLAAVRRVDLQLVATIFSNAYDAECVIDDVLGSTVDGIVQEAITDVRVHFIANDEALDRTDVIERSGNLIFMAKLASELAKLGLSLKELPIDSVDNSEKANSKVLEIILIVLSSVLAALLVSLLVVYFIKSQSYNRQIKALTDKNFGDASSDYENNITKLPNTNMFASGKSNPILNNPVKQKIDDDNQSLVSSDSDDFRELYDSPIFNISKPAVNDLKNPLGQKLDQERKNNEDTSYI